MTITTEDILQHHGVKGMKWGVRKDQISSKREAKAQRLDAKAKGYGDELSKLKNTSTNDKRQTKIVNSKIKTLSKKELQAIKDSVAVREGKMTRREKQVAVGAAVVAVAAAYTIGAKAQSGELNRLVMKGQEFISKEASVFKKNDLFSKDFDNPDDLFHNVVNGINDKNKVGGSVNCRRCTLSYEMRRRGNDVMATRTTTGKGQTGLDFYNVVSPEDKIVGTGAASRLKKLVTEGVKMSEGKPTPYADFIKQHKESGYLGENKVKGNFVNNDIFKALATQPDKARGDLSFSWNGGGAHSVAWEIVKGKPVIFDTQSGKMFKDPIEFMDYGINIKEAGFTRLDNKPLNEDFLKRWVKNGK